MIAELKRLIELAVTALRHPAPCTLAHFARNLLASLLRLRMCAVKPNARTVAHTSS
jgi:hypothetical protein